MILNGILSPFLARFSSFVTIFWIEWTDILFLENIILDKVIHGFVCNRCLFYSLGCWRSDPWRARSQAEKSRFNQKNAGWAICAVNWKRIRLVHIINVIWVYHVWSQDITRNFSQFICSVFSFYVTKLS